MIFRAVPGAHALVAFLIASAQSPHDGQATNTVRQLELKPRDPVTLPINAAGSVVSGIFRCTSDHSVFVQVLPSAPPSAPLHNFTSTDFALYGIRSPTDIVRFEPALVSGYARLSPIARYFATDSRVLAMAYGVPTNHGDTGVSSSENRVDRLLLNFDRKGSLLNSMTLDPSLETQQIASFPDGEVLLVTWDEIHKQTHLTVLGHEGRVDHDIPITSSDPARVVLDSFNELLDLQIRPYGQNLLLIPADVRQPILEVSDGGVVNQYSLRVPAEFKRGMPISLSPAGWFFRMIPEQKAVQSDAPTDSQATGLASAMSIPGVILEFDPSSGEAVRQFNVSTPGMEPACVSDGEFVFLTARASDSRLQLATALIPN
ncbi:MAG TPA: hypothetical protein VGF88_08465 [Acidobacteriaceae bacterium]|jgi:hypothetical protein